MPDRKYLELLSEKFPTVRSAYAEIINLEAILNLPKGTEHFISDVHGEYDAFKHILNNCSGVIRERVAAIFRFELTGGEQADLCTLIYYPAPQAAPPQAASGVVGAEWYAITLMRLVRLARYLSDSYTRSKVRKAMPPEYAYIIDELLHASPGEGDERQGYQPPHHRHDRGHRLGRRLRGEPGVADQAPRGGPPARRGRRVRPRRPRRQDPRPPHGVPLGSTCSGATTTSCGWAPPPARPRAWPP